MKKLLSILLVAFLAINSYSQENSSFEPAKNIIHGSLGTFVLFYQAQLSYDRLLISSQKGFFKSYYFTAKGGAHAYLDFSGSRSGSGYLSSLGVTALTGKGKNHFEVGLGLGYFSESNDSSIDEDFVDDSQFYPQISIGYRKQSSNGFMFRTGVGVAEWAYVGFGYSF